jgi:membrane fusion protein, multidrug efflux system
MTHRMLVHTVLLVVAGSAACSRSKPEAPDGGAHAAVGRDSVADSTRETQGKSAGDEAAQESVVKGGDEEAAPAPVVGAKTAVATVQRFVETMTVIGSVAPRPGHYAELAAPAPTRVTRIYVGAGEAVHVGAPLVEFDRAPFDAAAAGAAAGLTVAQHAYERVQRLAAAGIVPRKDVDQAAADLAQAQTTEITARRAQELSTLRAPLAGVVTHQSAVLGASVDPSQALVGVADPDAFDIVLGLSPSERPRVKPGDSVRVAAGQAGATGESLGRGVVVSVGVALDSSSRTLAVRVHIARPTRPLSIGETVTGEITVGVHPKALTIPVQALVPEGDGLKVFVVGADGLAHARPVTVAGRTEAWAEITEGLRAGETVVTEGAYGVEDSAKVVPIK